MTQIQKLGIGYALAFFAIAGAAYVPAFIDENGIFMSLFTLDFHDNLLHAVSGLLALLTALHSERAVVKYFFTMFGAVYMLDGIVGLALGNAFLDLGLLLHGAAAYPFTIKFLANLPHIVIGGSALFIGLVLAKRYGATRTV